jgi:hypothetical protein
MMNVVMLSVVVPSMEVPKKSQNSMEVKRENKDGSNSNTADKCC